MSAYGIDNDKRIQVVGLIMAISVILYYCIDYYLFAPYKPDNEFVEIFFFFLPGSSLCIAWLIILILKPLIFKYCSISNNSGKYIGVLKTSWDNFETEIPVVIAIRQTLFDLDINLKTENSQGKNNTAHLKSGKKGEITYTYINEGSMEDTNLGIHRGTGIIKIDDGKLTGRYYNDPRDRGTYGLFDLQRTQV